MEFGKPVSWKAQVPLPASAAQLPTEPELMGAEYAAPGGLYQAPLRVTDKVEIIGSSTPPFVEDGEMIGSGRGPYLRGDRPGGHELHPARVGLRPQRPPAADHQRLPQGLTPGARRAQRRTQTRTTRTPVLRR